MKNDDAFDFNLFEIANFDKKEEKEIKEIIETQKEQRKGGYCKLFMNLPNSCSDCVLCTHTYRRNKSTSLCMALPEEKNQDVIDSLIIRKSNCPLIPIDNHEEVKDEKIIEYIRCYKDEIEYKESNYMTIEDLEEFKRYAEDAYMMTKIKEAWQDIEAINRVLDIKKGNFKQYEE